MKNQERNQRRKAVGGRGAAWLMAVVCASLAPAVLSSAHAAPEYPTRPITLVVPFAPGGGTDMVARVLAEKLTIELGQSVVVENKSGANGNVGNAYVANAKADGYTVLYNTSSIATSPALYKTLSYDPIKSLTPVGLAANIPMVLAVASQVPADNLQDFISYARKNQDTISYGSSGVGNITQLTAAQFLALNKLNATNIPYRGSGAANIDLAAGRIEFMTDTINNVASFVRDGRMKLLAVATPKRVALFPAVPTFAEAGMPGFEAGAWSGMMVPAGTPKEAIERLNKALNVALSSPDVKDKLAQQGAEPLRSTPEEYGAFLKAEIDRWGRVIEAAGIKIE